MSFPHDQRSPSRGRAPSSTPSGERVASRPRTAGPDAPQPPRNVDLPTSAYRFFHQGMLPAKYLQRPVEFNSSGQPCEMRINAFEVLARPSRNVYQYDVLIGSGTEKRGLISKVWDSEALQFHIGKGWVFDGNRLGWNLTDRPEGWTVTVDMDKEDTTPQRQHKQLGDILSGQPSGKRDNKFIVQIRKTKRLDLTVIDSYLAGQVDFDNAVLEAVNFYDHLLRTGPAARMLSVKRCFFDKAKLDAGMDLGRGVDAMKGIYQSLRLTHGGHIVVNADVANTAFWKHAPVKDLATLLTQAPPGEIIHRIQKKSLHARAPPTESMHMMNLNKLRRTRIRVQYRGMRESMKTRVFMIKGFMYTNARETKFKLTDHETGEEGLISVEDYYKKKYNLTLRDWWLPCVETTKKGVYFPMELCHLIEGQRYPHKLNDEQTAKMIKVAVTRPAIRAKGIEEGIQMLDWANDKYLRNYGLKISTQMIKTKARLLTAPAVQFGGGFVLPGTSGRWRFDGQKFMDPNREVLRNWGVMVLNDFGFNPVGETECVTFFKQFSQIFKNHGGRITNSNPVYLVGSKNDLPGSIEKLHQAILSKCQPGEKPQLMMFMLGGRESGSYNRLKKSGDCRFGVVSQCMQNTHVKKCQGQYISNICLKVNAKLGGQNFRATPPMKDKTGKVVASNTRPFNLPTMVIGADVSHGGAGSLQASMAAMTVSMDKEAVRYAAACQNNGYRVELISTWNIEDMLGPLIEHWLKTVSGGVWPKHVIYFRDGVSEGAFPALLAQEIRDVKALFKSLDTQAGAPRYQQMKFTVIVASKRHHIRFFPAGGLGADKNRNPEPGVLVERDVTDPHNFDFYLCSHSAIQGTARPVKYHVLLDEMDMPANRLQQLIYESCYQYARSTTPVSIVPAIYYAHLASRRAVAFETLPQNAKPHNSGEILERDKLVKAKKIADETGKRMTDSALQRLAHLTKREHPPLIPLNKETNIRFTMWYT